MANFDVMADRGRQLFLHYDPLKISRRLGLPISGNFLSVRYIGEVYRVSIEDGKILTESGAPAGPGEMLTIYDYLCHTDQPVLLRGTLRSTNQLPGIGQSNPSPNAMFGKAAVRLKDRLPEFCSFCEAIGGTKFPVGDAAYTIPLFDRIPVTVQFFAGDDEFPDRLTFLWDENTLNYLFYETLYYIMGHLLGKLTAPETPRK